MNYTIYGLMHPLFMFFYYVGVTSNPLEQRVWQHKIEATKNLKFNTNAKVINNSLYKAGLQPYAVTLDTIQSDDKRYGYTLEKLWMAHISNMGHLLHNQDANKWVMSYGKHVYPQIQELHDYHRQGVAFDGYEIAISRPMDGMYNKPDLKLYAQLEQAAQIPESKTPPTHQHQGRLLRGDT